MWLKTAYVCEILLHFCADYNENYKRVVASEQAFSCYGSFVFDCFQCRQINFARKIENISQVIEKLLEYLLIYAFSF